VSDTDTSALSGDPADESDALLSRLQLIENQPLESRAAAFAQVYDELQARLEGADAPRTHGDAN
jgi:hypothetical protein